MRKMFLGCFSLKRLNLSNFDTNNVANMEFMFYECLYKLQMKIKREYQNIRDEAFE